MDHMHLYKGNQNTSLCKLKKKNLSHANFKKIIRTKEKKTSNTSNFLKINE